MPDQWVVLLEAAPEGAQAPVHADDLTRLLDALEPGRYGATLDSADRYALQVSAQGAGPVDALLDVVARWADAVRHLGLPAWRLVRAEVFTPEDLEGQIQEAKGKEISVRNPEPSRDLEDEDEIGHQLLHRAFSDPLTGLLGRHAFEHQLEPRRGRRRCVAVVSLGLDGFHGVNDRLGRSIGDEVLTALARRLAALLRPEDVLARLAGDEFGVLLEDRTEESALAVAGRLLDAVRLPLTVSGHELTLASSAGVAISHPDDELHAVLDHAEAALAAAKRDGGGPVLYGSDIRHLAQTARQFVAAPLQDRLAHIQLMQQAAVAANEAETLHQAAQVMTHHLCSQIGCDIGHLWMPPSAFAEVPDPILWHGAEGAHASKLRAAAALLVAGPDVGLASRVVATGRPVWIAHLSDDESLPAYRHAAAAGLRSAFAFPVVVGPEVVAVLAFFSRIPMETSGAFLDVLAGIGTQLGRVVERQRAVEALRCSAEHLRASEYRLRDAEALGRLESWHVNLRSGAVSWSGGTLYGMNPLQPWDLRAALAAVHPDDRARAEAALSLLLEKGESFTEEMRIMRSDGEVRWHRSQGSAIKDDDGVVVALQGTSQDITEAKLARKALRDRERLLAEAQRAARLGCWELELSSGHLTWSEEMYRLWGWEPDREVTFEAFLATVHPHDRQRLLEEGARLHETGEPSFVDFRATVADGRERWFRGGAHVLLDEQGRVVKLFGTDQDITEEKQAEYDLRRTQALYQRIVETSHEGIVTVDAQHVITFVNSRMGQILGYSVEEMTGLPVSAFVPEGNHPQLAVHQQRRRRGMSDHYPTQFRTKDGSLVQALVSASPIMDEKGDYVGALAMIADVTAVREAEDILRGRTCACERSGRSRR